MPNPEETAPAPVPRERSVALEKEFGERSRFAWTEITAGWTRAITQQALIGFNSPAHDALVIRMLIADMAESVRQAEQARPQLDAEPIGKPFSEEEDAGLTAVSHVGPNIKKFVRSNRFEKPLAEAATEPWSHAPQGERDETHKRAPFPQIERERDLPLEKRWISLVMDEDRSFPRGQEERFAGVGQEAAPARSAQIVGEERRRHRTKKLFRNSDHAQRFVAELR